MYTTSEDFKTIIDNPSRKFECKVICGSKTYTNVNIVNINITGSLQPSGYTIGSAISQKATFKFINDGNVTFPSNIIQLQIGLLVNGSYEYIPMGVYRIDSHDSDDYTITITAYDNMMLLEKKYSGTGTTLTAIAEEICTSCGITLGSTIPTTTVTRLEKDKYTCREVIGYVAGCMCGNAVIDRTGQLKIQNLNLSSIDKQVTTDNWFTYKNADMIFSIEKLICDTGNGKIESGSSTDEAKQLTIKNALMTQSMLDSVKTELSNITFTGFDVKYQGDISTDLGDTVKITDRKGQTLTAPLLQKTINYNGGLTDNIKTEGKKKVDVASSYYANGRYSLDFDKYNYKFGEYDNNFSNINIKFNGIDLQINSLDSRVAKLEKGSGGATLDESIYIIDTSRSTGVKEISFNIPFTDSKSYETNWGDGIVNKEKSHTYTTDGEYTIKTQVPYSIDTSTTFVRKSLIEIVKLAENITDCRWGTSKDMGGFQYCTGLKKVGDILGIKNGFYMFSGCTNLKHPANIRDLENAEGMYSDCTNLLDTGNIPNNLKVCLYMFSGCTKLKYINNLNSIANAIGMFENCTSIESLPSLPQTLISSSNMFSCCTMLNYEGILKIPENLKGAKYMFDRCTGLKCSVDFSDNAVLEDAEAMFTGCNNIKSFNQIPMSISDIRSMFCGCWNATFTITKLPETTNFSCAFQNCYKLTKAIAIPETAKTVDSMYSGCKLLSSAVKIPDNVTSCVSIYSYCNKLSEVQEDVLPNNSLGVDATRAFAYSGITTAINIYNNTKAVEMFYGCNDLKTMANILDGVTTANGLYNSSGITNPNEKKLPDSLQWIDEMFANTRIEETVNYIPASCSSVRKMFFKCSKLTKITTEFLTFMANATLSKYNRQGTFFGCYAITDPDTYSNMKNGEYADWFNI